MHYPAPRIQTSLPGEMEFTDGSMAIQVKERYKQRADEER